MNTYGASGNDFIKAAQNIAENAGDPAAINPLMFALPYLSERDQLNLRSTCRFYRDALRDKQTAPWQTKEQFCMAVTGNFNSTAPVNAMLKLSWNYYCKIIADADMRPAIIHKLHDHDRDNYADEPERVRMEASGRIYDPGASHSWAFNAIWMLANIHKGRSFVVISNISDSNLQRRFYPTSSAFAKEIAAAMQAKYTLCVLNDNVLRLMPPDHTVRSQVKLVDMKLSDAQVTLFYRQCKNYKDKLPKPEPANNDNQCMML